MMDQDEKDELVWMGLAALRKSRFAREIKKLIRDAGHSRTTAEGAIDNLLYYQLNEDLEEMLDQINWNYLSPSRRKL